MKKLLIVAITVLASSVSYSQDYYEIYKNHLPKNFTESFSKEVFNTQISSDASLNLDLIYWRLLYYNKLFKERNTDNSNNGLSYLKNLKQEKYQNRNYWIREQIKILDNSHNKNKYYSKVLSFFKKKLIVFNKHKYQNNLVHKYNKNLDMYYRILFLGKKRLLYDEKIDYKVLVNEQTNYLIKKINNLSEDYKNSIPLKKSEFIENIIDYWYIINNKQDKVPILPKFLLNYYKNRLKIKKENRIVVSFGLISKIRKSIATITTNSCSISPINFKLATIKEAENLSLDINYKYYLKDENTIFSFIDVSGFFNISEIKLNRLLNDKIHNGIFNFINSKNYTRDYLTLNSIKYHNDDKYGLHGKISTPIIFINDYIFISLGLIGGGELLNYSFDINYNLIRVQVHHNGYVYKNKNLVNEKDHQQTISKKKRLYYISPLFSTNINLYNYFNLELFLYSKAIGINFGYTF